MTLQRRLYVGLITLAAIFLGCVLYGTSAQETLRRNPRAPLPAASEGSLIVAVAESLAAIREQMPWRSDEQLYDPLLLGPVLFARLTGGDRAHAVARIHETPEWQEHQRPLEEPRPPPAGPSQIAGRLRVEQGRFRNDAGWWQWRGISEFDAIHLVRTGQETELVRRLDADAAQQRNLIRVFAMASNLFALSPDMPGYGEAVDRVVDLAAARGMYVEIVLFADASRVMPDPDRRRDFLQAMARRLGRAPPVLFQIVNEPGANGGLNGFRSADDPDLLHLARVLESELGHRDFAIGDPPDGDTRDATAETLRQLVVLARRSNVVVLHSSRRGGAAPESGGEQRLRPWVDHLEGFSELLAEVRRQTGRDVAGVIDEPMGAATQRWVPLGDGRVYEREPDPQVHLIASLTAAMTGVGYTYHRIAAQDEGTPGLDAIGAIVPQIPVSPDWRYYNDSWPGSATKGFSWHGGKVRTWRSGARAWVLAYGTNKPEASITWANGFDGSRGRVVFDGSLATVWELTQ